MSSFFQSDSRDLLILAIVFSVLLAQGQSEDEIGRMAAFFEVVGDVLALFALQPGLFQGCKKLCQAPSEEIQPDRSADS